MTGMTTKTFLVAALMLHAAPLSAQLSRSRFGGIPLWVDSAMRAAGLDQQFMLSSELNPVYAVGDFDRDGLFDLAIEVKDRVGLRCGLVIIHRVDRSVHVVGAGRPVGNGTDQLSCGSWGVQPAQHSYRDAIFSPDLLYVAGWQRDHRGWLIWNDKVYTWVAWE